jgi:hypothetical protein
MFNCMAPEMSQQASAATRVDRELTWRHRLARFASSGQSVKAFCRNEAVSVATFYGWRARLRARDGDSTLKPTATLRLRHRLALRSVSIWAAAWC